MELVLHTFSWIFRMSMMHVYIGFHGPHPRYIKLRVGHAPAMSGTFSPPLQVSDPDMHRGMCVTHVPWSMSGSLTSGFLLSQWWEKRSRHSRWILNPQFYTSGKRPMVIWKSQPDGRDFIVCLIQTTMYLSYQKPYFNYRLNSLRIWIELLNRWFTWICPDHLFQVDIL